MPVAKEAKPSIVEIFRSLSGLMMGEELNALRHNGLIFPRRFLVTEKWVLLEADGEGIVKECSKADICGAVSKFLDENLVQNSYQWTAKTIRDFVDHWLYLAPQIPLPRAWAFASEPGLTFHRLPFDLGDPSPTPTWDELLGRMQNAQAFKLWVGSLFDDASDRQTYVWLYGRGQNGKGAILRFLKRIFGKSYSSETVPRPSDRFWTHGLLGKRVVAFADTNDVGFPASGLFKSLTGGDAIRMEIKGGSTFTSDIVAKFIIASNERPMLSSECADMRRAILCEMEPITGEPDPKYGDTLWSEGGAFLTSCHNAYLQHGNAVIVSDADNLAQWVAELEDRYDAVCHEHFKVLTDHIYDNAVPRKDLPRIEAKLFSLALSRIFSSPRDIREFRDFIARKYGIKRTTIKTGTNKVEHCYLGIEPYDVTYFHPKRHIGTDS